MKPSLKHKHSDISPADVSLEEDHRPLKGEAGDSQECSQDHVVSLPSQMLGLQKQGYYALKPLGDEASKGMEVMTKPEFSEEVSEI